MRRARRSSPEIRVEMAPLIDVVFLLLTFFVFAMLLMVRAEVLDITLPAFGSGQGAQPAPSVVVAIDAEGELFVDGEPATLDTLAEIVRQRMTSEPDAVVRLAADRLSPAGVLLGVIDRLSGEGLADIQLFGAPDEAAPPDPGG